MYFIWNIQRDFRSLLWIKALFILLLTNSVYAQNNSDYLKSLEGEASGLKLDGQTKSIPKKTINLFSSEPSGNQGGAISELTPGLSIEQFGQVLKNNYIGSFLFYHRLSPEKQNIVFEFYQSNPDPQKVREKILQVSKK